MKTNRHLAKLVIADVRKMFGIETRFNDRLTREEAKAIYQAGCSVPELAKAITDKGSAGHASVRLFADVLNHFIHEHPQAAGDAPAEWPARPPTGRSSPDNPFLVLHPDEAEAHLAWAKTTKEYREAHDDPNHPLHDAIIAQTTMVMDVVHGVGDAAAAVSAPDAPEGAPGGAAAAEPSIDELRRDPAYLDGRHPDHKAAVEAVTRAYEAAAAQAAGGGDAGSQAAGPANAGPAKPTVDAGAARDGSLSVAQLRRHPAYLDRRHPAHQAAVDAVRCHYEGVPMPDAIRVRLADGLRTEELRRDVAYLDRRHPDHHQAVAEMAGVYERAAAADSVPIASEANAA